MGFGEIGLILIVALIVLGPTRLPEVARSLGQAWGKFKIITDRVKADFNGQLQLNELEEKRMRAELAEQQAHGESHDG